MTERRKPIFSLWLDFNKKVLGPDVSDLQRREMKMAFYAGVLSYLDELTRPEVLSPGEEVTADDEAWMAQVYEDVTDTFTNYLIERGVYTPGSFRKQ